MRYAFNLILIITLCLFVSQTTHRDIPVSLKQEVKTPCCLNELVNINNHHKDKKNNNCNTTCSDICTNACCNIGSLVLVFIKNNYKINFNNFGLNQEIIDHYSENYKYQFGNYIYKPPINFFKIT